MADLRDLKSVLEIHYPGRIYSMLSVNGTAVDEIRFTKETTPEEKVAIQAIADSFDWKAAPPNIPGFFDALGKAVIFDGSIPIDVYLLSLIVKDQSELKYQQLMLSALAANPAYTKEQKIALNALLKQFGLLLPEVNTR
jgi:hypothetical protein